MLLAEWITTQAIRTSVPRRAVSAELAEASGVSLHTIEACDRGMKLALWAKAKALSEATGGAVSVEELCG